MDCRFGLVCPSVSTNSGDYIKPTVKIEAGAKSALAPHHRAMIQPYVADDMPAANLVVPGVVTIDAKRTFWDKVVILHGLRCWHDKRGTLRQQGHRVSRHYYDIYKLIQSPAGRIRSFKHTNRPVKLGSYRKAAAPGVGAQIFCAIRGYRPINPTRFLFECS